MKWRNWKLGLFVATITGLLTAFAVGVVVPSMTLREGFVVCLGSIAKDVLLFLKQHPAEQVSFDTSIINKPIDPPTAI